MMAVKWNDPHFSPSSILMSELHSNFGEPIVIDHDVISDLTVAAEKVKEHDDSTEVKPISSLDTHLRD